MEKYKNISVLTKEHLKGKLNKLTIEYENDDVVLISVTYEDDHNYWFDYQLSLNNDNEEVNFLHHVCSNIIGAVALDRDKVFEHAVTEYLLNQRVLAS